MPQVHRSNMDDDESDGEDAYMLREALPKAGGWWKTVAKKAAAKPPLTVTATDKVHAKGDCVVHRDFGICDVTEVRSLGRFNCIQSHINNDRLWVDLEVDACKVKSVRPSCSRVNYKGQWYERLSGIGGGKSATTVWGSH